MGVPPASRTRAARGAMEGSSIPRRTSSPTGPRASLDGVSLLRESPGFFAFFSGAIFAMVAQGFYIGYTRKHPTRELRRREDPLPRLLPRGRQPRKRDLRSVPPGREAPALRDGNRSAGERDPGCPRGPSRDRAGGARGSGALQARAEPGLRRLLPRRQDRCRRKTPAARRAAPPPPGVARKPNGGQRGGEFSSDIVHRADPELPRARGASRRARPRLLGPRIHR